MSEAVSPSPPCRGGVVMCARGALIGLIDIDGHNYPNLCLMKLSAYHNSIGDQVEWYTADGDKQYDIVYMSKVFGDAYSLDISEPTNADRVIKGGTGYAIKLEGCTKASDIKAS